MNLSFDFYVNIGDSHYGLSLVIWPLGCVFGIRRAETAEGRRQIMFCLGPIIFRVCDINWIRPEELVDDAASED